MNKDGDSEGENEYDDGDTDDGDIDDGDTDDSEMSEEIKHDTDEQLIGEDNIFSLFHEERIYMGALDSDGEEDFQI